MSSKLSTPVIIILILVILSLICCLCSVGGYFIYSKYAAENNISVTDNTNTYDFNSDKSNDEECNFPEASAEYWWEDASQVTRDCYIRLYGEPDFLNQPSDVYEDPSADATATPIIDQSGEDVFGPIYNPVETTYDYVMNQLQDIYGDTVSIGSPQMTPEINPSKIKITYTVDGEGTFTDVFVLSDGSTYDKATVIVGPENAGGTAYELEMNNNEWFVTGVVDEGY